MPDRALILFAFTDWTTLVIPGVGILAAVLVPLAVFVVGRLRGKRQGDVSKEEDLSWEDLLDLLRRSKERTTNGQAPDLPEAASLEQILAHLPATVRRVAVLSEDERQVMTCGAERRTGRRRWGNPTEVHVGSTLWPGYVHGLVVNRSTGGLAIFLDKEI